MPRRQGAVVSVQVLPLASGLAANAYAGDTQLVLDSVDSFQSFGGTATIVEQDGDGNEITEQVTYGAIDDELELLFLTAPLQFSYQEGADVITPGETTMVDVDLDDGEDPVPCELSHALKTSTVLAEGQRGDMSNAERVIIDEIAGRWMLVEVIGQRNLIDAGALDPTTQIPPEMVPDSGPTEAPASSPGVSVTPSSRALNVYATSPIDIWTTLVYEVALDVDFTNVLQTIRTRQVAITIGPTPDRTDMWVRATAENDIGAADPGPVTGPVRTMLIESVDVADFGLTAKKFATSDHMVFAASDNPFVTGTGANITPG